MKKIYAPFFLVFMYSCISTSPGRISYLGSSYKITDHVDVFVDASAITQPYTVIGKGFPESVIMTKGKVAGKCRPDRNGKRRHADSFPGLLLFR